MLERRHVLGLLVTLNLCVLIWQMSVQELPGSMLEPTVMTNNSVATLETIVTLDQQPASDFARLIDLNNFDYIMSQPECNENIEALIVVQSAPYNQMKRTLIRSTWGSAITQNSPFRLIFMLAAVPLDPLFQIVLRQENKRHGDMVQGNFNDAYRNMTYKHVMALKWFVYNCPHAQLLIKVDDDVYVNTLLLLKYSRDAATMVPQNDTSSSNLYPAKNFIVSQSLFRHPQNLLFCNPSFNSKVQRSYRGKWRVKKQEYSSANYPPYCPGYVIIYSSDVVLRLYNKAQHAKFFWIDDVLITGIVAQQTNINITSLKKHMLSNNAYENLIAGKANATENEFLFKSIEMQFPNFKPLWEMQLKLFQNTSTDTDTLNSIPPM